MTIALALIVFGAAGASGGSGLLAVYIAGPVPGNADFIYKRSLIRFHAGFTTAFPACRVTTAAWWPGWA